MLDHVLRAAEANIDYAKRLMADIPEEQMAAQPAPGMNHAAWVLGHLAYVFDSMIAVWGQKPTMSPEWKALFNVPSQPQPERDKYPSKEELMAAYLANYQRIVDTVKAASPEDLDKEFPNPKLRASLPTVGVAMVHILTSHQGQHLVQRSAWRRAQGMPGV
ncbi:MAG: DinB family protein [Planctomycetota bacterium]|nr:MAG: DinB family protein [Planctomycetota bacterium]